MQVVKEKGRREGGSVECYLQVKEKKGMNWELHQLRLDF